MNRDSGQGRALCPSSEAREQRASMKKAVLAWINPCRLLLPGLPVPQEKTAVLWKLFLQTTDPFFNLKP